jgi:Carbohydrate binding module (family 6)
VTVTAPSAGTASLTVRYSNGTTTARPMDISVNGTVVEAGHSFASTGTWDTWANYTLTVPLNAGANTVRLVSTSADGGPNLDYLQS